MNKTQTFVTDPETKKERPYTFDFSFWSHSRDDENYVDNQFVYENIGRKVLESAWGGYNSSLFAYGQTGAGKSYSMVGYGEDIGIIPKACDEIFRRIDDQTTENKKFKVEASMIEIYNEQVRDLFNPGEAKPQGLKVREHPKIGIYVDGLKELQVSSYQEISDLMEKGSQARTVASTNMNATSSRAHTIFAIKLTQTEIERDGGKEIKRDKTSKISLIDLAGSERAGDTGATGDRLKEGCAINKSLSALGNVISALVKQGNAKGKKKKKIFIPYRGSVLTWLMKDSLGGNAKTIMIAAMSPASICYEETLSTLKYANRAKQIKNKAVVNEDKNVKMIRELKAELAKLKKQLATGGPVTEEGGVPGSDPEVEERHKKEMEEMKKKLQESHRFIAALQKSDEERAQETAEAKASLSSNVAASGGGNFQNLFSSGEKMLQNMHADSMFDGRIVFAVREGDMLIGRKTKDSKPDIPLGGVSVQVKHAIVRREGDKIMIVPQESAKTFVNGVAVVKETELKNYDRIIIGQHTYKFVDPQQHNELDEEEKDRLENEIDYMYAQQEFADNQGLSNVVAQTKDDAFEKKMQEMKEKFEREKAAQQQQLAKEREDIEKRRAQMMGQLDKLKTEASNSSNADPALLEKQLAQRQKAAELKFLKEQQKLAERRKKLEEEMKRQEELASKLELKKKKEEEQRAELEQRLLDLIPRVIEANSIAQELEKPFSFRTKLLAYVRDDGRGNQETQTELGVQLVNRKTGRTVMWKMDKFNSRFYIMQEMYQNFIYALDNGEDAPVVEKESDAFWDPESGDAQIIGISMLYLKSLSHLIDLHIWTPIITNKGEKTGEILVGVIPVDDDGKELTNEFVQDPYSLEGKTIAFKIKVEGARGLPLDKCKDSYIKFQMGFIHDEPVKTKVETRKSTFPKYNFNEVYKRTNIKREFIDFLRNSAIKFEVFAKDNNDISTIRRPGTASRPSTAQQFDMAEKNALISQMEALANDTGSAEDMRRAQRQDNMRAMSERMRAADKLGNDSVVGNKKCIVRISPAGMIMLPYKLPDGAPEGSEACIIS
eukprot:CAMPEP_0117418516 /NCGR_PEP_ID=MMETSP0758-20121206/272_1 /TAXON_ID=63605 /ORGANISM="Percolomonas cosmopolitus, Strain AE-1 (ATCC 50343)" /LENGTH=1059 /DNA_ID=CAMNT_0005199047 /DNA_START=87 /DNA_END=3266 /DNA_ORIENTATION=+